MDGICLTDGIAQRVVTTTRGRGFDHLFGREAEHLLCDTGTYIHIQVIVYLCVENHNYCYTYIHVNDACMHACMYVCMY